MDAIKNIKLKTHMLEDLNKNLEDKVSEKTKELTKFIKPFITPKILNFFRVIFFIN